MSRAHSPIPSRLPPERAGHDPSAELAEQRAQLVAAVEGGLFGSATPSARTTLGGRRTLRFDPPDKPVGRLLHLHGGAFRVGQPEYVASYAQMLARQSGLQVHVPEYRLAPEHPFPAALRDALAALHALAEEAGDAPLLVAGDSAGGGLAAGLGLLSMAAQAPRIDALILHSPWLDLRVDAPAYTTNAATDPWVSAQSLGAAAELYLQGLDPEDPLASPLHASVDSGYPPTLITVGTGEALLDDARRFHRKLEQAAASSTILEVDEMEHCAVTRGAELVGSAETFSAVFAFVERIVQS